MSLGLATNCTKLDSPAAGGRNAPTSTCVYASALPPVPSANPAATPPRRRVPSSRLPTTAVASRLESDEALQWEEVGELVEREQEVVETGEAELEGREKRVRDEELGHSSLVDAMTPAMTRGCNARQVWGGSC